MENKLTVMGNKVYDKLKREFDNFKAELREKTPDEIIQSAYELVAKENILMSFEFEESFSESQYKAILKTKYPLDYLYHEWLDFDSFEMNYVQECIVHAVDKQIDYFKSQSKNEKDCR